LFAPLLPHAPVPPRLDCLLLRVQARQSLRWPTPLPIDDPDLIALARLARAVLAPAAACPATHLLAGADAIGPPRASAPGATPAVAVRAVIPCPMPRPLPAPLIRSPVAAAGAGGSSAGTPAAAAAAAHPLTSPGVGVWAGGSFGISSPGATPTAGAFPDGLLSPTSFRRSCLEPTSPMATTSAAAGSSPPSTPHGAVGVLSTYQPATPLDLIVRGRLFYVPATARTREARAIPVSLHGRICECTGPHLRSPALVSLWSVLHTQAARTGARLQDSLALLLYMQRGDAALRWAHPWRDLLARQLSQNSEAGEEEDGSECDGPSDASMSGIPLLKSKVCRGASQGTFHSDPVSFPFLFGRRQWALTRATTDLELELLGLPVECISCMPGLLMLDGVACVRYLTVSSFSL